MVRPEVEPTETGSWTTMCPSLSTRKRAWEPKFPRNNFSISIWRDRMSAWASRMRFKCPWKTAVWAEVKLRLLLASTSTSLVKKTFFVRTPDCGSRPMLRELGWSVPRIIWPIWTFLSIKISGASRSISQLSSWIVEIVPALRSLGDKK